MRLIFGVAVLALDIWALMNVWRSDASDLAKLGWTVGIIVFPVVGFLAWFFAGPKQPRLT